LPTILLEIDPADYTVKKTYMYANSQILAQYDGPQSTGTIYYYLHDRLGSVRQVIDTDGDVKNHYTYKPFGEILDADATVDRKPGLLWGCSGQSEKYSLSRPGYAAAQVSYQAGKHLRR